MKICKKCKVTNPDEAKFCRGCGVNLNASGDLGIWKVVLSIVAVIILGICVYAISESSSSDYIDTAPVRPSSSATETAANDGYDNADTYDDTMWVLRRMIHRKVMILHRHLSLLNPPHLFIGW